MEPRIWLTLAALSGFMGVGAGAFGAHGVHDPKAKAWLETGGHYQLVHALAVFACFVVLKLLQARAAGAAACCACAAPATVSASADTVSQSFLVLWTVIIASSGFNVSGRTGGPHGPPVVLISSRLSYQLIDYYWYYSI